MKSPHATSKPAELKKRLAEVERALEASSPHLFAEAQLLKRLLTVAEHGTKPLFAGVKTTIGAIELCLDLKGDWMSKQELVDMMLEGGYPISPATIRGLVNDALNYHKKKGRLAQKDDLFGKPEWLSRTSSK